MSTSLTSLQNLATQAAQQFNVPVDLFMAQIGAESSWNPSAVGSEPASNGQYAEGIAQFLPSTASAMNINPFNPQQALDAAAQYDSQLYNQTGSWVSAIEDYGTVPSSGTLTSQQQNVLSLAESANGNTNVADELGATAGSGAATFGTGGGGSSSSPSAASAAANLNPGGLAGLIPNIGLMVLGVVMIYVGLTRGGTGGAFSLLLPKGAALPAMAAEAAS